jgi:hypothetical protein
MSPTTKSPYISVPKPNPSRSSIYIPDSTQLQMIAPPQEVKTRLEQIVADEIQEAVDDEINALENIRKQRFKRLEEIKLDEAFKKEKNKRRCCCGWW